MGKNQPKTITYFLGAGASYASLPIVSEMPDRFNHFTKLIRSSEFIKGYALEEFSKRAQIVEHALSQNTSFDQAARLIHNDPERANDFENFRAMISFYFMWEQISDKRTEFLKDRKATDLATYYGREKIWDVLDRTIDPRYNSFFANYFSFKNNQLDPQINIVTWNIDSQFERASMSLLNRKEQFKNFKLSDYRKLLRVFPGQYSDRPNYMNSLIENSAIVRLNGCAIDWRQMENKKTAYLSPLYYDGDTPFKSFINFLTGYLTFEPKIQFPEYSFSWMNPALPYKSDVITLAKKIIQNSDMVVVIGYSFPMVNEEIDSQIFGSKLKENIKVIIQVPEKDFHEYSGILIGYNSTLGGKIEHREKLWDFYYPRTVELQ